MRYSCIRLAHVCAKVSRYYQPTDIRAKSFNMKTKLILAASALVVLSGCQMTNVIDDMPADLTTFTTVIPTLGVGDYPYKAYLSGGILTEESVKGVLDSVGRRGTEYWTVTHVESDPTIFALSGTDVSGTKVLLPRLTGDMVIVSNWDSCDGSGICSLSYAAAGVPFTGNMPSGEHTYIGLMHDTLSGGTGEFHVEGGFNMTVSFDAKTARLVSSSEHFDTGLLDISNDGSFNGSSGMFHNGLDKIYTHGTFTQDGASGVVGAFTSGVPLTSGEVSGLTFRGAFAGDSIK